MFVLLLLGMMTAQVESGICMVEKDCISIFTTDGKDYVTSLPFQVSFYLNLLSWMDIHLFSCIFMRVHIKGILLKLLCLSHHIKGMLLSNVSFYKRNNDKHSLRSLCVFGVSIL